MEGVQFLASHGLSIAEPWRKSRGSIEWRRPDRLPFTGKGVPAIGFDWDPFDKTRLRQVAGVDVDQEENTLEILIGLGILLLLWVVYDLVQTKHAILRNFPIIGHFRYWLEAIGPELRQYIVTSNNEERPFSRDQRSWIYASSKRANNYFGFGTDNAIDQTPNYLIIKQAGFPYRDEQPLDPGHDPDYRMPCAKVIGEARGRAKAFRPDSVINISAMSYGSLGRNAVEALNRGAALAGCLHNTGEGGISSHHRHGGDLIWQIGTGYFGCRAEDGGFSKVRFLETVANHPVKAIEVKLSQGAKPGLGGVLPAAKITEEIAEIRGIPRGEDCVSPSHHTAFSNPDQMLDFVEDLAESTGLPVGIKAAVGELDFWEQLASLMSKLDRGVDFITIDGGEGGTGAAPLVFSDRVSLPFKIAFPRVYRIFHEAGLTERVTFVGSGKLGFPETALFAFALGCDMVGIGREAMLSVGCIQAQRCHTDHCPTGVATQNRWLQRGLVPEDKAVRFANYVKMLRKDLVRLSHACGVEHPSLVTLDHFEILDDRMQAMPASDWLETGEGWGLPGVRDRERIGELMSRR